MSCFRPGSGGFLPLGLGGLRLGLGGLEMFAVLRILVLVASVPCLCVDSGPARGWFGGQPWVL